MANRTFLTAVNEWVIFPGYRDGFDGDVQTIGETSYHLPLPWLAMFRERDLVEDSFVEATCLERENSIAPIIARSKAIKNLRNAFSPLRSALSATPELDRYLQLMADELETYRFSYVTIEWLELDEPILHERFLGAWHEALRGFDDPQAVEAAKPPSATEWFLSLFGKRRTHPWLDAINAFTEFNPSQKLPPASAYLDGIDLSPKEAKLHAALLPGNCDQLSVWMPRA